MAFHTRTTNTSTRMGFDMILFNLNAVPSSPINSELNLIAYTLHVLFEAELVVILLQAPEYSGTCNMQAEFEVSPDSYFVTNF